MKRRSFKIMFRFLQLFMVLAAVFFISFFITLSVKTPHPIDHIKSTFFDSKKADDLINEMEKQPPKKLESESDKKPEVSKVEQSTSENKSESKSESRTDKLTNEKSIDDTTIGGRLSRIFSIKQAVAEQVRYKKNYVKLDEIPRTLRQAIIAVEDSHFYRHSGFDLGGIARATVVNAESGKIEEGGSTITQQLVKNLFLTSEPSFTRKVEELILSINMERNFTKDEILELYLNTIYFGSNYYGLYEASMGYFGKEPKDLTLAESTMLAGLPNAPSLYSPYVDFMLAKKRQLVVIEAMVKSNILTQGEAENAKVDTITLACDDYGNK